jgi:hypothetical protein
MDAPDEKSIPDSELATLRETLALERKKIASLESENNKMREEIDRLNSEKPFSPEISAFIEASGVLWKRKPSGHYESIPYCPTCKSTLADYSGSLLCLKCNWQAPIKSFEAPSVHHGLV